MVKSTHLMLSCITDIKTTLDEDMMLLLFIKSAINDYVIKYFTFFMLCKIILVQFYTRTILCPLAVAKA